MKIVVWKSPKVLSSLLRRVFGVREEAKRASTVHRVQ